MPFPKTWVEELVIEWLHLEGFLVEANLPVGVRERGGRLEADVVGARINNNMLEIRHIETGSLAGGQEGAQRVINKFSALVCQAVTEYFTQRLSFAGNVKYVKCYVASYWTQPTITPLTGAGITVEQLPNFICHSVLTTIERWKQNAPHKPKGKTSTLPESYWLLQLVDYLNAKGLLKCP